MSSGSADKKLSPSGCERFFISMEYFKEIASDIADLGLDAIIDKPSTPGYAKEFLSHGKQGKDFMENFVDNYEENRKHHTEIQALGQAGQQAVADSLASQIIGRYLVVPIPVSIFAKFVDISAPALDVLKTHWDEDTKNQMRIVAANRYDPNYQVIASNAVYKTEMAKTIVIAVEQLASILTSSTKFVGRQIMKAFNAYSGLIVDLCNTSIVSKAAASTLSQELPPSTEAVKKNYKANVQILKKAIRVQRTDSTVTDAFTAELNKSGSEDDDKKLSLEVRLEETYKSEKQLQTFVQGVDASGQLFSNVALLCAKPREAQLISSVASFASQSTLIAAGFQGLGPLAMSNPYTLGIMAAATVSGLLVSLASNGGGDGQAAIMGVVQEVLRSQHEMRAELRANFEKLFYRLDVMEMKFMKKLLAVERIEKQILIEVETLKAEARQHHKILSEGMFAVNAEVRSLREGMVNIETVRTIEDISKLVSEILYNEDFALYSGLRNKLFGYLLQPFTSSNKFLLGCTKSQITKDSVLPFSLATILHEQRVEIPDFDKIYTQMLGIEDRYVARLLYPTQISSCNAHCRFLSYNVKEYLADELKTHAVMPLYWGGGYVILHHSKHPKEGSAEWFMGLIDVVNPIDELLTALNFLQPMRIFVGESLAMELNLEHLPLPMTSEVSLFNPMIQDTLIKALTSHMSRQYFAKREEHRDLIRVSTSEFDALINIDALLAQNEQMLLKLSRQMPKQPDFARLEKLLRTAHAEIVCEEKSKTFASYKILVSRYFYIAMNMTDTIEPTTACAAWGTWYENEHNDRHGWSHRSGSGAGGRQIEEYKREVKSYWNQVIDAFEHHADEAYEDMKDDGRYLHLPLFAQAERSSKMQTDLILADPIVGRLHDCIRSRHPEYTKGIKFVSCHIVIKHEVSDTNIRLNVYVQLGHNSAVSGETVLKILQFDQAYSREVEGGITLNVAEAVYSFLYGGKIAGGTREIPDGHWQSHIAGNYSNKFTRIPVVSMRRPQINARSFAAPTCALNFFDASRMKITPARAEENWNLENTSKLQSRPEVQRAVNAYLDQVNKVLVWNYWTMKYDAAPLPEPKFRATIDEVVKSLQWQFKCERPLAPLNKFHLSSARALRTAVQHFLPYMVESMSTPEIILEMKAGVEKCMKLHAAVLQDIKIFKSLPDGSGKDKQLDDIITRMETAQKTALIEMK